MMRTRLAKAIAAATLALTAAVAGIALTADGGSAPTTPLANLGWQ
jgi:hypothetical protein